MFIFNGFETLRHKTSAKEKYYNYILIKLANYYYDFIQNRRQKQLKDRCLVDKYRTFYNFWFFF